MHFLVIGAVAFLASGLTLFSGFGLGTLLLPAMAVFFPLETAIALTAVVHLLNNLFKFALLGRHADSATVLGFGVPAVLAAILGAKVLMWLSLLEPLAVYQMFGQQFQVMPVKLAVAVLMVFFALFELLPRLASLAVEKKYLPLGGLLSGFFGGLSGHQGALRSVFLLKTGLGKENFVATGVVITLMVDIPRIVVYSSEFPLLQGDSLALLGVAVLAAFSGAFLGSRLLQKVTLRGIQILVAFMLLVIATALGLGLM